MSSVGVVVLLAEEEKGVCIFIFYFFGKIAEYLAFSVNYMVSVRHFFASMTAAHGVG